MKKLAGTVLLVLVTLVVNLAAIQWSRAAASGEGQGAGDPPPPPSAGEVPPGPEAVAPPAGFLVRDGLTGGLLWLQWEANAAPDLAGYVLSRTGGPNGALTISIRLGPDEIAYWDKGLENGAAYLYRLTAVNLSGAESAPAEGLAVPTDSTPPLAPGGLAAADTGLGERLDLTWNPSGAPDLAGYHLYRSGAPGEAPIRASSQLITGTSFRDSGLTDGLSYTYQVTAVDGMGNESDRSEEASGVPTDITPPAVPAGLAVTDPNTSDELAVSWAPNPEPDLAGYILYWSLSEQGPYERLATVRPEDLTYRDYWLSLGTWRYYRLSTIDQTGNESAPSAPVPGAPTAPPAVLAWEHGTRGSSGNQPNQLFAPRHASRQGTGNTLVVDTFNFRVIEVSPANQLLWEYTGLIEPADATRLANGHILITDEQSHSVLEVDYATRAVVWRYGTGTPGGSHNQLNGPAAARELPGGTIIIVDAGNHRLIEVDRQQNILWQYGTTGVSGSGPDRLSGPGSVQVLPGNRLLVADTGNNQVVEIDRVTTAVVWRYSGLNLPRGAFRLRGGNTLIADTLDHRLLEVTRDGRLVWAFGSSGSGDLYEPRSVEELPGSGHLLVVDQHHHRVLEITH